MSSFEKAHDELGVEDDGSELQMPNVFVTPPEEDQVPTWCCFDAANPSLSQVIERPETMEISPIAFSQDEAYYSSMESVGAAATSIVDDAIANNFEDDLETISDYGHELEDDDFNSPTRDVANDSDVVEVVKLRRLNRPYHEPAEPDTTQEPPQIQRPSSFKSRASRVFKTFAGSLRSKSKPRHTVSSSSSRSSSQKEPEVHQEPAPSISRSRTPTALRRGSEILSQLFTRSSMSSFDELALASPTSPTFPKYSLSESSSSIKSHLLPSLHSYETSLQDEARLEAASPVPTTTSRTSSRRFSVLSLQKLFSFGSATPITAEEGEDDNLADDHVQPEEPETTTTPVLRSVPSTPAFSSSSSNSGPETPTSAHYQIIMSSASTDSASEFPAFETLDSVFDSNQNLSLGLGLGIDLPTTSPRQPVDPSTPRKPFSPSSSMWGSITPKGRKKSTPLSDEEEDTSLEIRLDSLHFDSLSFDIDRFSLK